MDDTLASTASAGGTPGEVVYTENKPELVRYEPRTEERRSN